MTSASTSADPTAEPQSIEVEAFANVQIRPEELRLIGRYVSLKYNGLKWVGLVCLITKDTVVVMNILKMTIAYFEGPFKDDSSKRAARNASAAQGGDRSTNSPQPPAAAPGGKRSLATSSPATQSAAPPDGRATTPTATTTAGSTPRANADGTTTVTPSADPFRDPTSDGAREEGEPEPMEPPKLLPFVTFSRKDISEVQFASDHGQLHHSFHAGDPTSANFVPQEQILRVYIRRFIVHTAQGNNPHNITMVEFVKSRSKWVAPVPSLLSRLAAEELKVLLLIEEDIVKKRERQQQARAARQAGVTARVNNDGRVTVPEGAGREFLYELGVPSRTSYGAIVHLALSITGLLYAASAFSSADRHLTYGFIRGITVWVLLASSVQLVCGITSGYHGLNMSFPIYRKVPVLVRLLVLSCATGLVVSATIGASLNGIGYYSPALRKGLEDYYENQVSENPSGLCSFAARYSCSGFRTSCFRNASQALCQVPICAATLAAINNPCERVLKGEVRSALLPIAIIFYIATLSLLFDWVMFQRFYFYCKQLADAIGITLGGEPLPDGPRGRGRAPRRARRQQ